MAATGGMRRNRLTLPSANGGSEAVYKWMGKIARGKVMNRSSRWPIWALVVATGSLTGAGCQTYQNGQVLPSPYASLRDDIQYFPKGPQFPLANELSAMQAAETERQSGMP